MMNGWARVKPAAKYAGISERSFRVWLRSGLRHARLPSGHILIRFADIDAFLEKFCEAENRADRIVDEIVREIGSGR